MSSPRRQQHRRTSPLQRFKSCLQFRVLLISSLQGLITSDFIRRFKRTTGASAPRSTSGCTSAAWALTRTAAPSPSSPKAKVSTYLTTGARGKHLTAPFSYPALRLRLSASFSLCIQSLSLICSFLRYIDGIAGLFTSQLGHGRQELADAYDRQAMTLGYFPIWSYAHPRAIELAERLVCRLTLKTKYCFFNLIRRRLSRPVI